jgi:hypothetical protein
MIVLIVYPLGIPFAYFKLLSRYKEKIEARDEQEKKLQKQAEKDKELDVVDESENLKENEINDVDQVVYLQNSKENQNDEKHSDFENKHILNARNKIVPMTDNEIESSGSMTKVKLPPITSHSESLVDSEAPLALSIDTIDVPRPAISDIQKQSLEENISIEKLEPDVDKQMLDALSFLYDSYSPNFYYWFVNSIVVLSVFKNFFRQGNSGSHSSRDAHWYFSSCISW